MLELYGAKACPYTAQLREDLRWRRTPFVEYDVDDDPQALERMLRLCGGGRSIPVLVDEDAVVQIGFEGRSCYAGTA